MKRSLAKPIATLLFTIAIVLFLAAAYLILAGINFTSPRTVLFGFLFGVGGTLFMKFGLSVLKRARG